MVRPKSENPRSESPNIRMTKGEKLMILTKASIEGCGMSELVRRAVAAYKPTPEEKICPTCKEGRLMQLSYTEETHELDVAGKTHILTITGIPAYICECGEELTSLMLGAEIEDMIDSLVMTSLRHGKEIPQQISLEELCLGEKSVTQ